MSEYRHLEGYHNSMKCPKCGEIGSYQGTGETGWHIGHSVYWCKQCNLSWKFKQSYPDIGTKRRK